MTDRDELARRRQRQAKQRRELRCKPCRGTGLVASFNMLSSEFTNDICKACNGTGWTAREAMEPKDG